MTVEELRAVLGWSAVINYGLFIYWVLLFKFARKWVYSVHTKWFKLSPEKFDSSQYKMMGFMKICLFVFNLAPYLALRIVFD
ncbi:DUF6868 family protein [Candidatus Mycalebacterium sp.]